MTQMFISLLCAYALVGLLSIALLYLADRADSARRRREAPVMVAPALPRMSVATKWRREKW